MKSKRFIYLSTLAILTLALLGPAPNSAAGLLAPGAEIKPTIQLNVAPARLRTAQQMQAAAAQQGSAPMPIRQKPFLNRLNAAAYRELKAKAALKSGRPALAAPRIAASKAPVTNTVNLDGVDASTAGYFPPDTHGAAGRVYFAEVTNSHLDIYQKATHNTRVISVSTDAWLRTTTAGYLAAPRMVYDPVYDRWIFVVTQWRTPADPTHQYLYLAVSLSSDPTGDYYVYQIDVADNAVSNNSYWDHPQLGFDRNAIMVTGDLYDTNTGAYYDSRMFCVAKSLPYNGKALSLNLFTGLDGPLAPPIVLDTNSTSFLVAADVYTSTNSVALYALQGSASNSPVLTPGSIPVATFGLPPYALQSGTTQTLDTGDARFENASTQIGNSLFQVQTINDNGYATPRFYEFDTLKKSVIQSGTFSATNTSDDFNASIAANIHKDVFVTWSSTDPSKSLNAQVRFSGRLHTDPPGVISGGSSLFGSTTYLSGETSDWDPSVQRWGDYSAVSLDPSNPSGATAWIVNEYIRTTALWGSRIGRLSLPPSGGVPAAIDLLLLSN